MYTENCPGMIPDKSKPVVVSKSVQSNPPPCVTPPQNNLDDNMMWKSEARKGKVKQLWIKQNKCENDKKITTGILKHSILDPIVTAFVIISSYQISLTSLKPLCWFLWYISFFISYSVDPPCMTHPSSAWGVWSTLSRPSRSCGLDKTQIQQIYDCHETKSDYQTPRGATNSIDINWKFKSIVCIHHHMLK